MPALNIKSDRAHVIAQELAQLTGETQTEAVIIAYVADYFSSALAKSSRMPLLFKGNDVSQTDVKSAL